MYIRKQQKKTNESIVYKYTYIEYLININIGTIS